MEKEENVYVTEIRAEEEKTVDREDVDGTTGASQNASAVPEKFKDVDALARAYGSLQAEFTRRSQKLKELEKIADNFKSGEEGEGESGVEKLRKVASARRLAAKEFDRFVAELCALPQSAEKDLQPATVKTSKDASATRAAAEEDLATIGKEEAAVSKTCTQSEQAVGLEKDGGVFANGETVSSTVVSSVASRGNGDASADLYAQVCQDESVRLRVIGEYLSSLGKSGAPLTAAGAGVMTTPPMRAKNISEAGVMALQYFKKPVVCD